MVANNQSADEEVGAATSTPVVEAAMASLISQIMKRHVDPKTGSIPDTREANAKVFADLWKNRSAQEAARRAEDSTSPTPDEASQEQTTKYQGPPRAATLLASRAENSKLFEDLWKKHFGEKATTGDSTSVESSTPTPKVPTKK